MTSTKENLNARTEYSNGFDSGNYDAGYVSETIDPASWDGRSDAYRGGYILGFFGTFESHEVPGEWREEVETLRRFDPR